MSTIEGILKRLVESRNPYSETAQGKIAKQCDCNLSKVSDVAKRFHIVIDAVLAMHQELEVCRVERDTAKNPRFQELFTRFRLEAETGHIQTAILFDDQTIGKGENWGANAIDNSK